MNARPYWVCSVCMFAALPAATVRGDEKPAPPEVKVVRPVERTVTDYEDFNGRTEAAASVEIRARVTGYLEKVLFKEGSDVKKGDLLFEIDARPYQAEYAKAEAGLELSAARLKLAVANLERTQALAKAVPGTISPQELDKAVAERAEAEASLRVAKTVLDAAKLTLDFTRITAPFNGRIGRHYFTPGNLVRADETTLATLFSKDPMHTYFDVDERSLLQMRRAVLDGKLKGDDQGKFAVSMGLADEKGFPRHGMFDFTDNRVDPGTGTIRMRAVFANTDGLLVPGLFCRIRMATGSPYKALAIPDAAVRDDQGLKLVFVLDDKDVVVKRYVQLGQALDGLRVVKDGLKAEDRIVVENLNRLRPGLTVKPKLVPIPHKD